MKKNIYEKISGVLFLIAFICLATALSYSVGRDIMSDYNQNGIWAVVRNFIIGVPVAFLFIYIINKLEVKLIKKE